MRGVRVGALSGLVLAVAIGVPAGAAGSRGSTAPTAPPCTSTDYTLTVSFTPAGGTATTVSATGAVDFVNDALTTSITLPSTLPFPALAGATVQGELVGGTVYVQVPSSLSSFVGGASWVSLALPTGVNGAVDALLASGASWCANAQSLVTTLSHGATVSSLGSTSVAGQQAKGTDVRQSGKKILKALKLPKTLTKKMGSSFGKAPMHLAVWSDPQGRIAEVSLSGGSISVDLQLTNVNQPVTITAPAGAVPLPPAIVSFIAGAL